MIAALRLLDRIPVQVRAMLALLVAVMLWGSSFMALKVAVAAFDPVVMIFGRMGCSLIVLLLLRVTLWRRSPQPLILDRRLARRDWLFIVLLALCEPCFYFVFEGYGIQYTTASQAGMIVATLPLAVVIAAWLLLGERPGLWVWVGFLLAVCGVVWLNWGAVATENAPNPVLGNCLEVLAMLCAAFYVICAKQLSPVCAPVLITTMQSVVGFLFFMPLLALPVVNLPDSFPLLPSLAVVYLGAVVTLVSFLMYNFALRHAPASRVGAFLNLTPVFSLFFGMLFLDESLAPGQWAACALVLGGVVLSQKQTGEEV